MEEVSRAQLMFELLSGEEKFIVSERYSARPFAFGTGADIMTSFKTPRMVHQRAEALAQGPQSLPKDGPGLKYTRIGVDILRATPKEMKKPSWSEEQLTRLAEKALR
jgi:hypothetical protein